MYKTFFGLRANPFGVNPDPQFLYVMPHIREALACLYYGIKTHKGFIVLTGEVGTGKTTLLKAALDSLSDERLVTSYLFNPRLDVLDFFEFVLTDFGIPFSSRTKAHMLLRLNQWLLERFRAGETAVIVVDEAQHLSPELLEEIRLLTNLETSTEKLLQIVLAGQPELAGKLCQPSARQIRQRVTLLCKTRALTREETRAYLAERLRIAGATAPVFSPEAADAIYMYAKGIPRTINMLSEHALITAHVEELCPIPARIVEDIAQEFDLNSLAHAIPQDAELFLNCAACGAKANVSAAVAALPATAKEGSYDPDL
jgi:type II secretory pathway predicted ATPase ExeA